jgi:hypothetical protein
VVCGGARACGDPVCARHLVMRKHQPPSSITSGPPAPRPDASAQRCRSSAASGRVGPAPKPTSALEVMASLRSLS